MTITKELGRIADWFERESDHHIGATAQRYQEKADEIYSLAERYRGCVMVDEVLVTRTINELTDSGKSGGTALTLINEGYALWQEAGRERRERRYDDARNTTAKGDDRSAEGISRLEDLRTSWQAMLDRR
jgi:hypothetical protein